MKAQEAIKELSALMTRQPDYAVALDKAIEALEKQVPEKLGSKVMDYMGRARPECGNCGEAIEDAM